jgi:hypothetical protein
MGASASHLDPRHVRIWNNLSHIESPAARIQMLETLLAAQEYVNVAKQVGIYAAILQWKSATQRGEFYPWPVIGAAAPQMRPQMMPPPSFLPIGPPPPSLTKAPAYPQAPVPPPQQQLARVPPPKRALDALHQAYEILGLDDSTPLTHDSLRSAYKRAALKVHPDKGGSPEEFDAVSRAFLYVQEVLEKLVPKSSKVTNTHVTPESAYAARGIVPTAPAPPGALKLEDAPPIALNPKKLDMNLFNKLFEENKLPDPDKEDGYGDWLKSQEVRGSTATAMRGKFNKDMFNKMFEGEAVKHNSTAPGDALAKYKPPSELTLAPGFGVELGGDRPAQFTKTSVTGGRGLDYTDLKFAYSEGSTFSQEVAGVSLDGRPKNLEQAKREYGSAPKPMSVEEAEAVAAFDAMKTAQEKQRMLRLASRDVDAAAVHEHLQNRLMIRN